MLEWAHSGANLVGLLDGVNLINRDCLVILLFLLIYFKSYSGLNILINSNRRLISFFRFGRKCFDVPTGVGVPLVALLFPTAMHEPGKEAGKLLLDYLLYIRLCLCHIYCAEEIDCSLC